MKLIRPTKITDANLIYSTEAENDHPAWSGATTYAVGAKVISGHKRYESVQASNLNKPPATNKEWWLELGPTNRWAMFDQGVGTLSKSTGSVDANGRYALNASVKPGICDSVAVLDVNAQYVYVEILHPTTNEVQFVRGEFTGDTATITNWLEYFTEPIVPKTSIIFQDLPTYPDSVYSVTLQAPSTMGQASVGTMVFGRMYNLGLTQYGASFGIVDYSRKTADEFGVISVVERGFAKRINASVEIDNGKIDEVDRVLSSIRATPVVWIGADNIYTALITYGFYKDWSIDIQYFSKSFCSLQIEGLST